MIVNGRSRLDQFPSSTSEDLQTFIRAIAQLDTNQKARFYRYRRHSLSWGYIC
jgi:hypothetical protein